MLQWMLLLLLLLPLLPWQALPAQQMPRLPLPEQQPHPSHLQPQPLQSCAGCCCAPSCRRCRPLPVQLQCYSPAQGLRLPRLCPPSLLALLKPQTQPAGPWWQLLPVMQPPLRSLRRAAGAACHDPRQQTGAECNTTAGGASGGQWPRVTAPTWQQLIEFRQAPHSLQRLGGQQAGAHAPAAGRACAAAAVRSMGNPGQHCACSKCVRQLLLLGQAVRATLTAAAAGLTSEPGGRSRQLASVRWLQAAARGSCAVAASATASCGAHI